VVVVYTATHGWADTKCLMSLSTYPASTPHFNLPTPWALDTYCLAWYFKLFFVDLMFVTFFYFTSLNIFLPFELVT